MFIGDTRKHDPSQIGGVDRRRLTGWIPDKESEEMEIFGDPVFEGGMAAIYEIGRFPLDTFIS